jgi:phenylacetate-CoA ligase
MSEFYDTLETRDPEQREQELMIALSHQVAHAKSHSEWYAKALAQVDPTAINSRQTLASLPVTRKHNLIEPQKTHPPFAGLNGSSIGDSALIFTSPGPLFEMAPDKPDFYGSARAFFAAGMRKGDILHNSFSYHLTPGAWIMHSGARALGCPVIPAGVGNSEQQVQVMAQVRPKAHGGTPDYLKALIEKADEMALDVSSVTTALVGGGPLFPQLREWYGDRGIAVFNTFATAELGMIAYETASFEGLVVAEDKIIEILIPGTETPVANEGDVGELVVTLLNPDYPLIRFATGDLTAITTEPSPCGRTNMRMKGWMGRADQTTKIRGMFVHPEQVAEVNARHSEILKSRLEVDAEDSKDIARLTCEVSTTSEDLESEIANTFQNICKVRGTIVTVSPGTLPNDGKVIDDVRKFD